MEVSLQPCHVELLCCPRIPVPWGGAQVEPFVEAMVRRLVLAALWVAMSILRHLCGQYLGWAL